MTTTSAHDSNSDDSNANEFNSDANKSDSDVYFKSDDSDSDDEYDHELHERLQREEMARLAKLEDKTPTKPDLEDYFPEEEANEVKPVDENATNDLDKILMKIHENHDIYFDDLVYLLSKSPPHLSGGYSRLLLRFFLFFESRGWLRYRSQ